MQEKKKKLEEMPKKVRMLEEQPRRTDNFKMFHSTRKLKITAKLGHPLFIVKQKDFAYRGW